MRRLPVSLPSLLTCLVVGSLALGCASSKAPSPRRDVERGTASWYGAKFHGRPTASGETFDMHAVSAAHRTLPFGTVVEVTNLDNGRRLRVRINDRGPFVRRRILDLSYAAAQKLDMVAPGVAQVEIRVVTAAGPPRGHGSRRRWAVQAGAFREAERARRFARELKRGFRVYSDAGWHRVQRRGFKKVAKAETLRRKLARRGVAARVVEAE